MRSGVLSKGLYSARRRVSNFPTRFTVFPEQRSHLALTLRRHRGQQIGRLTSQDLLAGLEGHLHSRELLRDVLSRIKGLTSLAQLHNQLFVTLGEMIAQVQRYRLATERASQIGRAH